MKYKNQIKSFTLVEVLVSITILIVALLAGVSLLVKTIGMTSIITDKFIAANLAQEGIELVRNIRDNNFLNHRDPMTGLASGIYYIDYNDDSLTSCSNKNRCPYLRYDDLVGYSYDKGKSSKFRRYIVLFWLSDHELRVNSVVEWNEKNVKNLVINAEDHLYSYY